MKRRIFKLGLLVLAGAIINIAVASRCTFRYLNDYSNARADAVRSLGADHFWRTEILCAGGCEQYKSYVWVGYGPDNGLDPLDGIPAWCAKVFVQQSGEHGTWLSLTVLVSGWPARTVWCLETLDWRSSTASELRSSVPTRRLDGGIDMGQRYWIVPYRILWPGFAVNTIFYAAILWMLFAAPVKLHRVIRRQRRIRRGLCPACAYPVGSSDICTECGEQQKGVLCTANRNTSA